MTHRRLGSRDIPASRKKATANWLADTACKVMIWAKRSFEGIESLPFSVRLSELLVENSAFARHFIMVSVAHLNSSVSDFYIGLPHKSYLSDFTGFEIVDESDVPLLIDTIHVADPACEKLNRFEFPGASAS